MIIKLSSGKVINNNNVSIGDTTLTISDKKSKLIIPLSRVVSILDGKSEKLDDVKKQVDA